MLGKLSYRQLILCVMLASMGALAGAYIAQYGFAMKPCILCLYQRVPYFVILALAFPALFLARKAQAILLILCAIAAFSDVGIAAYHVAVEQKLIVQETSCAEDVAPSNSIEELRAQLMGTPHVACDKPQFVFLGISMAGWNLLYSLGLALFILLFLRKNNNSET